MSNNEQQNNGLQRTMKARHLFMISLGGCIGTGFFLGSGYTINQAGSLGAVLSYLVGGLVMYLTLVCLGELSVAMPESGSFQTYATKFIGPATGFAIGWLYWLGWGVTVALEFLSSGQLMQRWFPDSPIWMWCLIFTVVVFLLNALSAKAFGESEFVFSSIKILAILLFIIVGGAAMFGLVDMKGGESAPFFSHFVSDGLFPNGVTALLITMISVNFSFQGTELIGIAAGESENPEKTIPRSIRQTVWRTLFFFVLSVVIVAGVLPREQAGVVESPFVAVLDKVGVPYAADIMNFVILIALLSVANSGLYAATRILYSLSKEGMASPSIAKVNKKGIPMNALLITLAVALLSLLSSVFAAETVFVWLLSLAGLGAQIGWIAITWSHLAFRKKYVQQGGKVEDLKFKTPLYPFLPAVALIANCIVMASMAFDGEQRLALYWGGGFFIACYIYYFIRVKGKREGKEFKQEVELKEGKRMMM
ncbi:amino acid permease [Priestia endophytica]|uniref:Amino acid permease n=1 Tax=Priestia endophytica TaxID=135735 RepID=A0AAX1Q3P7_9BACI|nr:amino acid permease [Priestia endophytica]RAS72304.1 amino acid permease [Priestia endophytica]RAS89941.1 amino acid permease [Priestia endophytica]